MIGRAVLDQATRDGAVPGVVSGTRLTWPDLAAAVLAAAPPSPAAAPTGAPTDAPTGAPAAARTPDADGLAVALTPDERALIWQDALERSHRDGLVGEVVEGVRARSSAGRRTLPPATAGLVTCIDVRSERLRRHLEAAGGWRTWGTAGFFGVAVRHVDGQGRSSDRCPALLTPQRCAHEAPASGAADAARTALGGVQAATAPALALAELGGWAFGLRSLMRTWRSLRPARQRHRVHVAPAASPLEHDLTFHEQVAVAEAALRTIGLVTDLPRILVLAGHGGSTTNNPYAAAYDCGACGGVSGEDNARLLAGMLNDPMVRAALAVRGLVVPAATTVLAAVHDTTRDEVRIVTPVPDAARQDLEAALPMLSHAAGATARERAAALDGAEGSVSTTGLVRRSQDWAEVRPEWGLAGAAAIVVGGRELTAGLDLAGRAFLQSYSADTDPDATVLGAILGGPVVVAQWITSQYSFSSLDPGRFGAGDKALHNAVGSTTGGLVGVLAGPRGDLRIGLPWQAVFPREPGPGVRPVHTPQRLLCLVEGTPGHVDRALRRAPGAGLLVDNGWIRVVVVDAATGTACERRGGGGWVRLTDPALASAPTMAGIRAPHVAPTAGAGGRG